MRNTLILFLIINGLFGNAQSKKFRIDYVNMTSFSIAKNAESYFLQDSIRATNGLGFDINTIHGAKFFGHVAISGGISIDWNINKTFLSTPYIVDVRVFSSKDADNSLFAYLQTGKNIKWSSSFDGNGTTSKLGVGAIFKYDTDISLFVDLFKKSKVIELEDMRDRGNYHANGFGISVGVIF